MLLMKKTTQKKRQVEGLHCKGSKNYLNNNLSEAETETSYKSQITNHYSPVQTGEFKAKAQRTQKLFKQ